jgi:hypothetical protein
MGGFCCSAEVPLKIVDVNPLRFSITVRGREPGAGGRRLPNIYSPDLWPDPPLTDLNLIVYEPPMLASRAGTQLVSGFVEPNCIWFSFFSSQLLDWLAENCELISEGHL